jgi:branched-chain amino acid aminotransferase
MLAYLNGKLVAEEGAGVAVFDHGLTVGDGVFETIALRDGVAMALSRHLARLRRSAVGLGLFEPDLDEVRRAVGETVAANQPVHHGAIRVTYTSGPGTVGSARGEHPATVVIAVRALPPPAPAVDVATVPWPRNERGALVGLKTTSYAENVMALAEARKSGAAEALFANTAGNLCEGSGTNIFLGLGGRLVTPPLSAGCLAGITRGLLIERCGLEVEERDVPVAALADVEEAFLTSAVRDVQSIAAIDGRRLPAAPGPLTRTAIEAYASLLSADPDPA